MLGPTDPRILRNPCFLPFQEREREQMRAADLFLRAERARRWRSLGRAVPVIVVALAAWIFRTPS